MFNTNYENLQNIIIHDHSYDLNLYRSIFDQLSKNVNIYIIDVKFILIKRSYIFFLKDNVSTLRSHSENLKIAFNKRIKRLLSKTFNRFNQFFFIKTVKSVINCIQNVLIFNLLNFAKLIQHLKELIKNSKNVSYKMTEFLINLKEIDTIKTLIDDLKDY